jgi:hypothetical protein
MPDFGHKISKRSRGTVPGPATTRNVTQKTALPGRPEAGSAHALSQVRESLNQAPRVREITKLSRALQQRPGVAAGRPVMQRASADIVSPNAAAGKDATTTTVIDASPSLAEFDAPTIGRNAVATPAKPPSTPKGTPAYIANVITTALGKDKKVGQISEQYAAEAFDSAVDAAHRFALVVLANREEKPSTPHTEQDTDLAAASTEEAKTVGAFPAASGRAFWRRKWSAGPDADHLTAKSVDEIRTILEGASDPKDAATKADSAARAAGLPPGVPNTARNKARGMPQTAEWTTSFTNKGYTPYVHVGDADAVTMKATAAPDGSGAEKSLFSRYDALIASAPKAEALSGGYRFALRPADEKDLPAHAKGARDSGKGLMARTEQAVKVSELDMQVRAAMQRVAPGMPYFPEPNIAVRADLYTQPGVGFGDAGTEWLKLRKTLLAQRDAFRGKQEFVRLGGREFTPAPKRDNPDPKPFCKFPIAVKPAMTRLFRTGVKDATPPAIRSGRGSRTPPAATEIIVFWSQATIERELGRALSEASTPFVFDRGAALVTDVGRFDEPYVNTSGTGRDASGTDYEHGETDPLALFDPARAHQSHAQWGAIKSSLEHAYAIRTTTAEAWLKSAMNIFLPQQLFYELADTRPRGTLATRTAAATTTLETIQGRLRHFSAFTTAISAEIADPSALRDAAETRQGDRPKQTRRHKIDAVADRLEDHGVSVDFLKLLSDADLVAIWDTATSSSKPRAMNEITQALKAIGDTIASFLARY